ncbi:MAG: hypothetical protein A3B74_04400 [Candidatus Kerfeldbacteria bacterium RIFCSPHIGHO2_02_FULL_42_14]|uniref:Peptidase M16 n=1 Tax=Candidatus Kerfeldbacteria bacterium RIFCSPHIGHO2_02_FULL_42_14 TaxID=1798540 RepID=A0A1G2ANU6_9BACT|nr:MAG: hypothetical protein A3B74_04400 [Candidatus Kerfeldbacteria bacterium RIFCSPHIGHO2_02_FULL_42_14]OGY80823.1 MAG: hypothetical protein A3E60_01420 [Candidatus Kerfeldbacteria bacterium RIFCSPHIGHO2_12_FULL_42_13]OGY84995.1 MAG: hypothetical protein A3I91_00755 [Candidatus Kerfeldbacteria bacterium RIFCSPLOWO2_02_FULL_42_19]OGY86162.1 MAG: hypothetical protein A3G01_02290 [Candidatus Kerfeldbacteria bacterium RIFCSPLOWO2_12_FULL_43_9]
MYQKHTLPNGVRIITAPLHETNAVTVLIMFKVGSRYETQSNNGISHFLEHLFFKGTKRRPSTLEISKALDGVGAEYNAFTSKDYTGYYIKLQHQKFELALDILSDILFDSLFLPKEIERERGVIIEEINMYDDNPMANVEEQLERIMYGDHPLGWSIAGPKKTIHKITRPQILTYRRDHYHADNTIITIAGKIPVHTLGLVKKYFGGNKFPKKDGVVFQKVQIQQRSLRIKAKYKKTEQYHIALGWPAYHYTHHDLDALKILMTILGGNMSSRLFIGIRERLGLCYFIRGSVSPYEDVGNIVIQAGVDKRRIREAIAAILEEVKKIRDKGVTKEELNKAVDFIKGKVILELEDSESLASWVVRQEMFHGKILTPSQKFQEYDRLNREDILRVANDIFHPERINLAYIGPERNKKIFENLLHF